MKTITILGATGSIGQNTLDVILRHAGRYRVYALTAHAKVEVLAQACGLVSPAWAVVGSKAAADALRALLGPQSRTKVAYGEQALIDVCTAPEVNAVMAAIVGGAGLAPTLAAARAGKDVLLSNKESLVMAGALLVEAASVSHSRLLPVDSEHSAIFQCLDHDAHARPIVEGVSRLLLTASGGPFLTSSASAMGRATPEQAVAHPKWRMGPKISVDSATMMNKGLEVIEARWLFGLPERRIDVVIHPQSVVHSFVEFDDGSVLAQLGTPDMRTPIAYALGYPQRIASGSPRLDIATMGALTFEPPDKQKFVCLQLAYNALAAGPAACVVLNAANEVAVAAFLAGQVGFDGIASVVESCLAHGSDGDVDSLASILEIDRAVRVYAGEACGRLMV